MEPPKPPTTAQVAQLLSSDLQAHFRNASKAFLALDVNRSGKLETAEVQRTLEVYNIPANRATEVFNALDKDNSGSIDYSEFCQLFFGTIPNLNAVAPSKAAPANDSASSAILATATAEYPNTANSAEETNSEIEALSASLNQHFSTAAKAFLKLDTDRTGRISVDAIRELQNEYNLPSKHVEEIMKELDVDANGTLSYQEMAQKLFYYSHDAKAEPHAQTTPVTAAEDEKAKHSQDAIVAMSNALNQHFPNAAEAFLKLDANRTGRVSMKDFEQFRTEYNLPLSIGPDAFAELDTDHDGTLDFNEVAQRLFYLTSGSVQQ